MTERGQKTALKKKPKKFTKSDREKKDPKKDDKKILKTKSYKKKAVGEKVAKNVPKRTRK